jgi:YfiH family protein
MTAEAIRAEALAGVPHGFLSRRGGVSHNRYRGLNVGLGSGDDPRAVAENRELAVEAVERGAKLVTLHQIHSATAFYATAPWPDAARPEGDALVTDRPGLLLGILTADCAPVLLADKAAGVVGAAHAGWKGALHGVTDAVIAEMETRGADRARITAAIGPCIAPRTKSTTPSRAASRSTTRRTNTSSPSAARATTSSTSKLMWRRGWRRRGSLASKRWASTLTPTKTASSASAAPRIAASPTTAARSR